MSGVRLLLLQIGVRLEKAALESDFNLASLPPPQFCQCTLYTFVTACEARRHPGTRTHSARQLPAVRDAFLAEAHGVASGADKLILYVASFKTV